MNVSGLGKVKAPKDVDVLIEMLLYLDPNVANTGSSVYQKLRQMMFRLGWDSYRFGTALKELRDSGKLFLSCSRKTISFQPISSRKISPERPKKTRCVYCGVLTKKITKDHVLPKSRGGAGDKSNIVWACFPCNQVKNDRTPEEWARDILSYRQRAKKSS